MKTRRRLPSVLPLLASLTLTSCAQRVWTKPGASDQDFATDRYGCERDVRQSGYYGTGLAGAVNMNSFFSECMNAHGWSLTSTTPDEGSTGGGSTGDWSPASSAADGLAKWHATCLAQCTGAGNPHDKCVASCAN